MSLPNCFRCGKQPCECEDGITLYHGDCRDVLPLLPRESVDLVLTSPPYNLGDVHRHDKKKHRPYPDGLPEDEYQKDQVKVLTMLHRLSKCVFYVHKNRIIDRREVSPRFWIRETPWICRQVLVWVNGGPNHSPVRFFPKTERVFWLAKEDCPWLDNHRYWDFLTCLPDRRALDGDDHTRTFPLSLASVILEVAPWAKVCCDPYAGRGTTGRACKNYGRRCIMIEVEERYCEMAAGWLSIPPVRGDRKKKGLFV